MAFVASMLRLGRRALALEDPGARALEDAANRIQMMAAMHRRLYSPASLDQPLDVYFRGLVEDLTSVAGQPNVECKVDVIDVDFDLDRLQSLSLLLLELVTNCLKHAFNESRAGVILVRLYQEGDQFCFEVSDNGQGLADPTAMASGTGLGNTITKGLASQLAGVLVWSNNGNGTTARLTFPRATINDTSIYDSTNAAVVTDELSPNTGA